jgi:hypothetical protein
MNVISSKLLTLTVRRELPVIISLEVHTCIDQQEIMVEIMEECWKGMLVDIPLSSSESTDDLALPRLDELRRKILIKVKYTPPSPPEEPKPTSLELLNEVTKSSSTTSLSSSSPSEVPESEAKPAEKKGKICEALGRLGIYTRSYHFKSFDQPGESSLYLVFVSLTWANSIVC